MPNLTLRGIHKYFGSVHAVRGVDLDVAKGEFVVLVGPSGCGKSTILRLIAGLEELDEGTIEMEGRVINEMRPRDRDIAMVFQNYALYPYLTVFENIAFGLRARKVAHGEIRQRVDRAAQMLNLTELLNRLPRQLSGGQRQRVAMGRAIVRDPKIFLFDEPLSNLDAQLRDEMRSEIKGFHQQMGRTTIYVTHDQIEAMTLADRIVLLRDGKIEQMGQPLELYERPRTKFVARFIGAPPINFLKGRLRRDGENPVVQLEGSISLQLPKERLAGCAAFLDKPVILGVRPEHVSPARAGGERSGVVEVSASVLLVQPTGARTFIHLSVGSSTLQGEFEPHASYRPGDQFKLQLDMNRAVLIDPANERVIW